MRKALFAASACVFASGAAIAQLQPLNVKTGQWQVTLTSSVNATLPPEAQAALARLPPAQQEALRSRFGGGPQTRTYPKCLKQTDLANGAFQDPNQTCNWTTVMSSPNDMQLRGTMCRANGRDDMTGDVTVTIHAIDSENATGSVQFNAAGRGTNIASNSTFTSKWVGAACTTN
jgi:hypothetical protein